MKQLKLFFYLVFAALASVTIYSSCGDDDDKKEDTFGAGTIINGNGNANDPGNATGNTIVGIWVDNPQSTTYNAYIFNNDGTGYFKDHGYSSESEQFHYAVSGEKVYITWIDDSDDEVETYRFEIANNGNTLLLYETSSYSGEQLEFMGVRQQILPGSSNNQNIDPQITPSSDGIVGIWVDNPQSTDYTAFVFYTNGSGYWKNAYYEEEEYFTYTIQGNTLNIHRTTSYGIGISSYTYSITNNGNTLLIYVRDSYSGSQLAFTGTRVQQLPNSNDDDVNVPVPQQPTITNTTVTGTWRHDLGGSDYELITINDDGTGSVVGYEDGERYTATFTYTVSGNTLYISTNDYYYGTRVRQYRIVLADNGNTLFLYRSDSYSREYLDQTLYRI